ncbi:MAG: MFS transporter [Chloroflexi bacterium]|nr:MFS transporter [Chloroflexota bacterium]
MPREATARRDRRFYYGWVIVAVMAMVGAVGQGLGIRNFGLFIRPMEDDLRQRGLEIGRSVFGGAQMAVVSTSALTSPLVGWLIDRFGSRVLLVAAAAITAAALAALALVTEAWHLVALFAATGLISISGPAGLVNKVPVAKWFVRKRGRALGLVVLGNSVGGVVVMPLTQVWIEQFGWQKAWMLLGVVGAAIIIPLSLALVRRQPEDMGLTPDGETPVAAVPRAAGSDESKMDLPAWGGEVSWTLAEAVRTTTFWRLVLVFTVEMLAGYSVGVHRIPHFADRGLDPRWIAYAAALEAVASGVTTFSLGFVLERVPVRFVGAGCLSLLGIATLLTIPGDSYLLLFVAMPLFGVGAMGQILVQNHLWPDYFGRRYLGSIRGVVLPLTILIGSSGAPLAGYVRDSTGSYGLLWLTVVALLAAAATLLAFTPAPRGKAGVGTASARAEAVPQRRP